MKTFQLKVLACFLMLATIFAACEQDAITPTDITTITPSHSSTDGATGISEQTEGEATRMGCGTLPTTESLLHSERIFELAKSNSALTNRSVTTFSLQFHVIRSSNGTGGTTQAIIDQKINQLNQAYSSSNIQFERCEDIIFNDNDAWHIPWAVSDPANYAINYNVPNVINVFIPISMGGPCCLDCTEGLATYPDNNASTADYVSVGLEAFENKPEVFIHEMGHFFGLYHTHESSFFGIEDINNCSNTGDRCCDTPPSPLFLQNITTPGCGPCGWDNLSLVNDNCQYIGDQQFTANGIFHGCQGTYTPIDFSANFPGNPVINPLTNNYMSSPSSPCQNSFTPDQIAIMNVTATFDERADLVCDNDNGGGGATSCPTPAASDMQLEVLPTLARIYVYPYQGIKHQIQYQINGGAWIPFNETTSHYNAINTLRECSTYAIQVRQECDGDWSGWSDSVTFTTGPGKPTYNQLIQPESSIGCNYAHVYCYYHDGDMKKYQLRRASDNQFIGGKTHTSYRRVFTGLSPNTEYKYRVKKQCGTTGDYGPWSPYKHFTTTSCN